MQPKNILILSCNTGEGHNSSAKALKNTIESEGIKCTLYDTLSLISDDFSRGVSDIYNYSVRSPLFSTAYKIAEWYSNLTVKPKSPIYLMNRSYINKLYKLIKDDNYDVVITVHLFAALSMTSLREKYHLKIPTYFVATDYTTYPFLEETHLDGYMIAHPHLKELYMGQGIPERIIYSTGIPCMEGKLKSRVQKNDARKLLDELYEWNLKSYTGRWFLIMGGSMGYGNMMEIVSSLERKCSHDDKILCVCGRNHKEKEKLDKRYGSSDVVKVIGFTDKIPLMMDACDLLCSKPGGLTSTEALIKNIPLIHTKPIKGVEDQNAKFFNERGMSYFPESVEELVEIAVKLCDDRELRKSMMKAQIENLYGNSGQNIISIIKQKA